MRRETSRAQGLSALSSASPAQLVAALSHPNGWWRDNAQRLLVERRPRSVIPALAKLAQNAPDWRVRLHALWTLDGIDAIEPADVARALDDVSRDVRAAAIRLAERWLGRPNHPLRAAVLKRLQDTDWAVRRQLAASLGVLPASERDAAVISLLDAHADAEALADAVRDVKAKLRLCSVCNNITDVDPCIYCSSTTRNQRLVCVVEEPTNIAAIEKTRHFHGAYHVLHGSISPLRGVGPEELRISNLLRRVESGQVDEIILATNPTVDGEATAVYLSGQLKRPGLKVTRIAMGIPVGSDIEYADEITMLKAMEGRREL